MIIIIRETQSQEKSEQAYACSSSRSCQAEITACASKHWVFASLSHRHHEMMISVWREWFKCYFIGDFLLAIFQNEQLLYQTSWSKMRSQLNHPQNQSEEANRTPHPKASEHKPALQPQPPRNKRRDDICLERWQWPCSRTTGAHEKFEEEVEEASDEEEIANEAFHWPSMHEPLYPGLSWKEPFISPCSTEEKTWKQKSQTIEKQTWI